MSLPIASYLLRPPCFDDLRSDVTMARRFHDLLPRRGPRQASRKPGMEQGTAAQSKRPCEQPPGERYYSGGLHGKSESRPRRSSRMPPAGRHPRHSAPSACRALASTRALERVQRDPFPLPRTLRGRAIPAILVLPRSESLVVSVAAGRSSSFQVEQAPQMQTQSYKPESQTDVVAALPSGATALAGNCA